MPPFAGVAGEKKKVRTHHHSAAFPTERPHERPDARSGHAIVVGDQHDRAGCGCGGHALTGRTQRGGAGGERKRKRAWQPLFRSACQAAWQRRVQRTRVTRDIKATSVAGCLRLAPRAARALQRENSCGPSICWSKRGASHIATRPREPWPPFRAARALPSRPQGGVSTPAARRRGARPPRRGRRGAAGGQSACAALRSRCRCRSPRRRWRPRRRWPFPRRPTRTTATVVREKAPRCARAARVLITRRGGRSSVLPRPRTCASRAAPALSLPLHERACVCTVCMAPRGATRAG